MTHSPHSNLDDALRAHYRGQLLSDASLDAMLSDVRAEAVVQLQPAPRRGWFTGPVRLGLAAALALVVTAVIVLPRQGDGATPMTLSVARHVVENLRAPRSMDVRAGSVHDCEPMLEKLPFSPIEPAVLASRGLTVLGARYCYLGPEPAVQFILVDHEGRRFTLYQASDAPTLTEVRSGELVIDRTTLSIWRESGVLLALAGPAPAHEPDSL
jgi:anti-sigma factor RsiW